MQFSSSPLEPPSWTREPEPLVIDLDAAEVISPETHSEASTLERRRLPSLRSTTRVQPPKVAPAPTVATEATFTSGTIYTRSSTAGHYTSGPRSDLAVTCSTSSLTSAGNGRPASTALTLDQMLSEWENKTGNADNKKKKYATWSQAPPAHLMAAIERQMSEHSQLEGTSTFCAAPDPIIEEDSAPPEERDKPYVLGADVSYAARTASLPTSEKARKRYQRRLVSGTAGPDAERIRKKVGSYAL